MHKASFTDNLRFGDRPVIDRILETPFSKEIRICMSGGSVMKEHTAPGAITVMVLSGHIAVVSGSESLTLERGDVVGFDAVKLLHLFGVHCIHFVIGYFGNMGKIDHVVFLFFAV